MEKVRKIISEIVEKQEINTVYFVGCGGSLSGFFPAKYFLSEETTQWLLQHLRGGILPKL